MSRKVSIIIPTYNRAHLINETLDSIIAQSYENWECIIVDDGSIDETKQVVEAYIQKDTRFKLFFRPATRKKGPSSCRNIGIENATGEFVLFLDSDDLIENEKIAYQVKFHNENLFIDVSISGYRYFESGSPKLQIMGRNNLIHEVVINHSDSDIIELFKNRNPMVTSAPLYKMEILKKVGFFDEDLFTLEDWDFHLRCALNNVVFQHIGYIKNTKSLIRLHNVSLMRNKNIFKQNEKIFYLKRNQNPLFISYFGKIENNKKPNKLKNIIILFIPPIVFKLLKLIKLNF